MGVMLVGNSWGVCEEVEDFPSARHMYLFFGMRVYMCTCVL
jgi:hypothetical protein